MTHRIYYLLLPILLFAQNTLGQGILFSEYRMILKQGTISSLQVCNPTEETRTYLISVINKTMDEQGSIIDIPDTVNIASSLKPWLRIFPKRIVLEPGGCQEVQLQLKMPASQPNGEYRSYLYFMPMTPTQHKDTVASQAVQMNIVFRVGAAIPIIYRKNTTPPTLSIDSISLTRKDDNSHLLHFTLLRQGTQSTYGHILIEGISQGKRITLATKNGNAIYHEANRKKFMFPISTQSLDKDTEGKVKLFISYTDAEDEQAKNPKIWVQTETLLPL